MAMIDMVELKRCPFCGADASMKWVLDDHAIHNGHGGKSLQVSCSREGECPSPKWTETASDHEGDAECLASVARFWNTRADEWADYELVQMRVRLAEAESEARRARFERDRAMKACEQISAAHKRGAADADQP